MNILYHYSIILKTWYSENKYEKLGIEYPLKGVPQLSKDEATESETVIRKAWGKML